MAVKGLVESWHSPIDIEPHCMLEVSFFICFNLKAKWIHCVNQPFFQEALMFRICRLMENRVQLVPKLCRVSPAFFSYGIICHYLVYLFDVCWRLSGLYHLTNIWKQSDKFQLHRLDCVLHLLQKMFCLLFHVNYIFFGVIFGGLCAQLFAYVK